jgi:hypothetical protein
VRGWWLKWVKGLVGQARLSSGRTSTKSQMSEAASTSRSVYWVAARTSNYYKVIVPGDETIVDHGLRKCAAWVADACQ